MDADRGIGLAINSVRVQPVELVPAAAPLQHSLLTVGGASFSRPRSRSVWQVRSTIMNLCPYSQIHCAVPSLALLPGAARLPSSSVQGLPFRLPSDPFPVPPVLCSSVP